MRYFLKTLFISSLAFLSTAGLLAQVPPTEPPPAPPGEDPGSTPGNPDEDPPATPPLIYLRNISTRAYVGTGDEVEIGGFILNSSSTVYIRTLGPTLGDFGVPGTLPDPVVSIFDSNSTLMTSNDNFGDFTGAIPDSPGAPPNALEPALATTLDAGAFTAIVSERNNQRGIALVEIYNTEVNSAITNISTRGRVGLGDEVMIGGFIIAGSPTETLKILIRVRGPELVNFGLANALQDPVLQIFSGSTLIAENDNHGDFAGIFPTTPGPPAIATEPGLVLDLAPGAYTAIVSGKNETTGLALIEIFAVTE